jgi:hypothetical protein
MSQLIKEAIVVTNVTATPIDTAGPISFETPINEQSPKNLESMKLFIKIVLINTVT